MKKVNKQQAGRALLVVGGGFGVIALVFGSYWHNLNLLPDIKIPNPVMPTLNARDLFIRAGDLIQDGKKVEYAAARRRAGTSKGVMPGMPGGPMPPGRMTKPPSPNARNKDDRAYSSAEKIALVGENNSTLQTFRQGLTLPYLEKPVRSARDMTTHYSQFRALARLLALEAQTRAAQGDWKGAVDSHLDCLQFGQMLPRGAGVIGMLVGHAIEQIGFVGLGDAVEHLTSAQARAVTQRAEAICAMHVPFADMVQQEKWSGQAVMLEMFRSPDWRKNLQGFSGQNDDDENDKRGQMDRLRDAMKLYFLNRGKALYEYGQYMDQQIANARLSAAVQPPTPPIPDDPINQVMLGIEYGKLHMRDAQAQAQIAQLALRLALRAYHEDHHRYPRTLANWRRPT